MLRLLIRSLRDRGVHCAQQHPENHNRQSEKVTSAKLQPDKVKRK